MSRMKNFNERSTRGEDLVIDFCACTCSTWKAFILPGVHEEFAACVPDFKVFGAVEPHLLSAFALPVLTPSPGTTEEEEMRAAAVTFKKQNGGGVSLQKSS